jgi:hypothetical protein
MLPDTARFAAVCVAACTLSFAYQDGTKQAVPNEKQLVIQTLEDIRTRLSFHRFDRRFTIAVPKALDHIVWLRAEAIAWRPATEHEGRGLRQSLQLILAALETVRAPTPKALALMTEIESDLAIKVQFCRTFGLSAPAIVVATTKQGGLEEVKGLEVWYIEKFLASDAKAQAHRFSSFSSPATETVAPGRYVFWSKGPSGPKAGEKLEQCLCLSSLPDTSRRPPTFKIDLLAP